MPAHRWLACLLMAAACLPTGCSGPLDTARKPGPVILVTASYPGANAQVVAVNAEGTGAMIQITPSSGPDETATQDLLLALRDGQRSIESATGMDIAGIIIDHVCASDAVMASAKRRRKRVVKSAASKSKTGAKPKTKSSNVAKAAKPRSR